MSKSGNNDKYTITYNIYILNILTNALQGFDLDLKKEGKKFDELCVLVQNISPSMEF